MIQTLQRFAMLSAMLIAYLTAFAYYFEEDGIYYNVTSEENRTMEVTYNENYPYSGDIEIPKKLIYKGKTYTVTSIGHSAFIGCSGLTSVSIPNSVASIGESAFEDCRSLTSVTIPNSVTSIEPCTFTGCSNLTLVTIPNSVKSIKAQAFSGCSSLTSVTIPNSVTHIGCFTFSGCSSLTSVTIPNLVTSIDQYTFEHCSSLTSVTIGSSVTSLDIQAFFECDNLETINVQQNNPAYCSQEGILYNKNLDIIIFCPNKRISVTIPNSVTAIGRYAFEYCRGLTSVSIPNSVISIGKCAFENCYSLMSVTIPNSVTSIGDYAFEHCSGLTSVTIPNSVNYIGYAAFRYCRQLETIYNQIVEPFDCDPKFDYNNFELTTLYVSRGSLSAYRRVEPWRNFWNIREMVYSGVDCAKLDGDSKTEVGRYNLQGLEVDSDYKGLIIIRYSDGSYCKMYAK